MIKSIRDAFILRQQHSAENTPSADGGDTGMVVSRGQFLSIMAAGAVTAGLGATPALAGGGEAVGVMPITDIDKLYDAWQERLNTGDLEGLADLYSEDVTYVSPSGATIYGRELVKQDLAGLLSIKPKIVLGNRRHILYQDIALTTNHWRFNFVSPDGVEQEMTGGGIEVMRKDPKDGGWRYIIDDASRSAV